MSRYVSESSGAVLDTKTGLRMWFESHREAIDVAERLNRRIEADLSDTTG